MHLDVIESDSRDWYADGLNFSCTQCGNCCTGGPGYVWVSDVEIARLAEFLEQPVDEVREKYLRKVGKRISLKEHRRGSEQYDCIFLTEQKVTDAKGIPHVRRGCSIYPVRPLQCRTWPFWPGLLESQEDWNEAAVRCHGMNIGKRWSAEKIAEIRDAKDWPDKPPTSEAKTRGL